MNKHRWKAIEVDLKESKTYCENNDGNILYLDACLKGIQQGKLLRQRHLIYNKIARKNNGNSVGWPAWVVMMNGQRTDGAY